MDTQTHQSPVDRQFEICKCGTPPKTKKFPARVLSQERTQSFPCDLLLASHETSTGSWRVRPQTGVLGQSRGDDVCGFTEMHHLWRETKFSVRGLQGFGYCPIPHPRCICLHAPHKQMINDLIRNWPPYCIKHNCIVFDKYISVFGKFSENEPNYGISVLLSKDMHILF